MFSIAELVESKGYKNLMKYVYGWGAAVVLIGALFKIQHYPGASIMLILGLSIEALIFFLSAFEPLHEELDWTLVYPELSGLTDDFEEDIAVNRKFDRANDIQQVGGIVGGAVMGAAAEGGEAGATPVAAAGGVQQVIVGGSPGALSRFDEMLEKADIGPEIFDKLGEGLNNLAKTTESLNDISVLGSASKEFAEKMQGAASSVGNLDETYQKSNEVLKESIGTLSNSYAQTAQQFSEVSQGLTDSYTSFANKLTEEINSVGDHGNTYADKLGSLNSNLAALNAVYELQTKHVNEHMSTTKEYYTGMNGLVEQMSQAAQHTAKLNEEVNALEQNVASLNNVYGNMLSSLNLK